MRINEPPFPAASLTVVQPGHMFAVMWFPAKDDDEGIVLHREPIVGMIVLPDWESISEDTGTYADEVGRTYDMTSDWYYTVRAVVAHREGEPGLGILDHRDYNLVGIEVQGDPDELDWMQMGIDKRKHEEEMDEMRRKRVAAKAAS